MLYPNIQSKNLRSLNHGLFDDLICNKITWTLLGFLGALLTQKGLILTSTFLIPGQLPKKAFMSPAFSPPTCFLITDTSIIGTAVVSSLTASSATVGEL